MAALESRTIVLVMVGPIERIHIPGLCGRAGALVQGSQAHHVVCDVSALVDPDAVTVDALARLQVTVQRLGRRIRVRHACDALRDLLNLMGLCDVLPLYAESGVDSKRELEQREEPRRVEEEVDPGDLSG